MYTWPCAPILAQYVYSQRKNLMEKKILEVSFYHASSIVRPLSFTVYPLL